MLVLHRKPGETIRIGDQIVITMLDNYQVGIDAPKDTRILRGELTEHKDEAKEPENAS